jgi:hypothetical protein
MDKISESNKQEAEKVVDKYYWIFGDGYLGNQHILISIQDRQSVLEEFKKVPYPSNYEGYKIQSLTEQIEYLKSKL